MDLFETITGHTKTSRRALIRGVVVGIVGITGGTAAQTGGDEAVNYLKDDNNDEEPTVETATLGDGSTDGDEGGDGRGDRAKEVVSQVDLTERNGRVTIRLAGYERVVADLNTADGNSIGHSSWRVDGKRAARSGVSLRAREGNTLQLTLQNPTPIPYSLSIRTDDGDGNRLRADGYGVTVFAGGVETLLLEAVTQGEYSYEIKTLTRPIEPLTGRLLVDSRAPDDQRDDETLAHERTTDT